MDVFSKILLGNFVGDYLLQNEWMSLNKSRAKYWLPGLVHAIIYTKVGKIVRRINENIL